MRKINKIMMATVSILLTLVLISSCVLSGIFAKYVTSKTASSHMQFERFGVVVDTVVDKEALEELGATVTLPDANSDEVKSGVYSVTIENLPIYPGIGNKGDASPNKKNPEQEIYNTLVKFAITGNANVPLRVGIETDIVYNNLILTVPAAVCGETSDTKFLPIGFTCYAYNYNEENKVYTQIGNGYLMGTAWRTGSTNTGAANRAQKIAENFEDKFDLTQNAANEFKNDVNYKKCAYKDFSPSINNGTIVFYANTDTKKTTPINAFAEGIYWPFSATSANGNIKNGDMIDTWLVQKNPDNASISITYTVTVTQTAAAT